MRQFNRQYAMEIKRWEDKANDPVVQAEANRKGFDSILTIFIQDLWRY